MNLSDRWPTLPLSEWRDTCDTLHMWTQIVGKIRMELSPHSNHWWSTALYVTPRGLTTSTIHYQSQAFDIEFDFQEDLLRIDGDGVLALKPRTVADFYRELLSVLRAMGVDAAINTMPQEFPNPIPFDEDDTHRSYDTEYVRRFHRVLLNTDRLLKEYQADWLGKTSPVHFFWGSFDLCVTRFNGEIAPERPGADCVTREAYSHACVSAGFWPGGGPVEDAAFYAYAAPPPQGYGETSVQPEAAYFEANWNEYLLMYEDARRTADPDRAVRDFLRSTYEAGANLSGWDRRSLERPLRRRPCASTSNP